MYEFPYPYHRSMFYQKTTRVKHRINKRTKRTSFPLSPPDLLSLEALLSSFSTSGILSLTNSSTGLPLSTHPCHTIHLISASMKGTPPQRYPLVLRMKYHLLALTHLFVEKLNLRRRDLLLIVQVKNIKHNSVYRQAFCLVIDFDYF